MLHHLTFRPLSHPLVLSAVIACLLSPTPAKAFVEILSGAEDAVDGEIDRVYESQRFSVAYNRTYPALPFSIYRLDDQVLHDETVEIATSASGFELSSSHGASGITDQHMPTLYARNLDEINEAIAGIQPGAVTVDEYAQATLADGEVVEYPSRGSIAYGDPATRSRSAVYRFRVDEPINYEIDHGGSGEDGYRASFFLRSLDTSVGDNGSIFERYLTDRSETPYNQIFIEGEEFNLERFDHDEVRERGWNGVLASSLAEAEQVDSINVRNSIYNITDFGISGQLQPGVYEIGTSGSMGSDFGFLSHSHYVTFSATPVPEPGVAGVVFAGLLLGASRRRRRDS